MPTSRASTQKLSPLADCAPDSPGTRHWLAGEIDDAILVERVRATFERLIGAWREARSVAVKERVA